MFNTMVKSIHINHGPVKDKAHVLIYLIGQKHPILLGFDNFAEAAKYATQRMEKVKKYQPFRSR